MEATGYLCVFCERYITLDGNTITCPSCGEYKGLTPVYDNGEDYEPVGE